MKAVYKNLAFQMLATVAFAVIVGGLAGHSAAADSCPLSHGFWRNHPTAWPVTSLTLGSQTYSQAELLTILGTPVGGKGGADASLILADQLIAAELNIANGSDSAPVDSTIADADDLLAGFGGKLPLAVRPPSETGQAMIADAEVLASYNDGQLTPDCAP
ncbi:MAG: hypothetical protein E6J69_08030 [Deltaproteobacteria bacterium]|nr:MAG: hypothetical protein E6J69_08030 [Deltaproteobacteria bacterium]